MKPICTALIFLCYTIQLFNFCCKLILFKANGSFKMSSQVITLPDEGPGSDPDGPGNQRNFYRHVSGAGEGQPLQTTAETYTKAADHIVNPITPEANQEELLENLEQQQDDQPANNEEPQEEAKNNVLEPDWQKKIRDLQDQVSRISHTLICNSYITGGEIVIFFCI